MEQILEKYAYERDKRLAQNDKGLGQYMDEATTRARFKGFQGDPWLPSGTPVQHPVPEGGHVKFLVVGAGFGGLTSACRLLQQDGITPEDVLLVDPAGGFGGTWWFNRFPGLMCDIESYIYLPLLEESGYMPKRKYASGEEIREYSHALAQKFSLSGRAMFQSNVKETIWDDQTQSWACKIVESPKGLPKAETRLHAQYVILASGGFPGPKLPALKDMDEYTGQMFHTSAWDYDITGGSQGDDPGMTKLAGKKVAFVGTGATGVQVVPQLAKYAGELYVFQRTPSGVDARGNRQTDPDEWKQKIASRPNWWEERNRNFNARSQYTEDAPTEDLVDDAFSKMQSYVTFGVPRVVKQDEVQDWIRHAHELDLPRAERVRERVDEIVRNKETAEKLKLWSPSWCKRPCFHDDFLPAFNRPNVHLIDHGDGRGVHGMTAKGVVAGGREYPVDIIVWGTGYASPLLGSLAGRAGIDCRGRGGIGMETLAQQASLDTLYGCMAPEFPNLFMIGFSQTGVSPNQTHRIDVVSKLIAHIVTEASRKVQGKPVIIEATPEAAEDWAQRVAATAPTTAPMTGCTPSYFNLEGATDKAPPEMLIKMARGGVWAWGMNSYADVTERYRAKGNLEGLLVTAAAA